VSPCPELAAVERRMQLLITRVDFIIESFDQARLDWGRGTGGH